MGTRGLCLGRWLFHPLLTEHYHALWIWASHSCPRDGSPILPLPAATPGPCTAASTDDERQPQNTATPTSSSCPPARHCQACLGLLARRAVCWLPGGEKRGAPWRGQGRCVQVRAATFLVISPTGRRGRRDPPGFPTPLFFSLTQKHPFFVPGVHLRGLAPEAPWRVLGPGDALGEQMGPPLAGPRQPFPAAESCGGPVLVASLRAQIAQDDLAVA